MIDFLKCFYSYVQKTPERAAVVDRVGERRTSYAELAEVSARLATWLLKQGIGREKLVAMRGYRRRLLISSGKRWKKGLPLIRSM